MSDLPLMGLIGSHPLGALAAFGLLRCCEELAPDTTRLRWESRGDWFAVLESTRFQSTDELITELAKRQPGRADAPELRWAKDKNDDIRASADLFREVATEAVSAAVEETTGNKRYFADFLSGFTSGFATNEKDELEPTRFYMTSGRQVFLKEVRKLAVGLASGLTVNRRDKAPDVLFREALLGPWSYEDPQHSLGWDPDTERLHALRAKSPTGETPQGVAAAVWLAFEALPLFPSFFSSERLKTRTDRQSRASGPRPVPGSHIGGRLKTRGFSLIGSEDKMYFSWPIWIPALSLSTLRSLLALDALVQEKPPLDELRNRGVAAVFRSERYKVKTQGAYFVFRPAFQCM
ncbi:MAG TPA: hypothetical protein VF590_27905 [Isosphaeraceae bacterium]